MSPNIWVLFIYLFFLKQLKTDFSRKMVKEWNFLHVVDISFHERFEKYYHFSLQFCEIMVNN